MPLIAGVDSLSSAAAKDKLMVRLLETYGSDGITYSHLRGIMCHLPCSQSRGSNLFDAMLDEGLLCWRMCHHSSCFDANHVTSLYKLTSVGWLKAVMLERSCSSEDRIQACEA